MKYFIDYLFKKPLFSFLAGLFLVGFFSYGAKYLYADFGYRIWFKESNKYLQDFDKFERKFGSDEIAIIAIHSASGIFDKGSISLLRDLTENLWQGADVIRVDSLTNYNLVRGEGDDVIVEPLFPDDLELTAENLKQREALAMNHNIIPDYLVSSNKNTAVIYLNLKPGIDEIPNYEIIVKSLRGIIQKYVDSKDYLPRDHEIFMTGTPTLSYSFQESSQKDMKKIMPVVFSMTLLFLALLFRNLLGVLLPIVIIVTSILSSVGFIGWIGIEFNVLTSIVPQFLVAISIAVAVHILASYFGYIKLGVSRENALKTAVDKNFIPTLLTATSTMIGFLTFTTSSMPPIAKLGIMSAFGTLISWLLTFLMLIPMLIFFSKFSKKKSEEKESLNTQASSLSNKVTSYIYKFRYIIICFYALLSLLALVFVINIKVSSDPFDYFEKTNPLRIANEFVNDEVGGSVAIEMVVDAGKPEGVKDPNYLEKVGDFSDWVEENKSVSRTISIVDIIKEMNQVLNGGNKDFYVLPRDQGQIAQQLFLYTMNLPQGMDINNRVATQNDMLRLTAMTPVHESNAFLSLVDTFEKEGKKRGLNVKATGKNLLYQSNNEIVVTSFIKSIALAIFLVSLLLIIGLSSVKIGLLSMIPNALPLLFGGAFVYALGKSLDIGTMIVGSVCLGIAVDDTIHFLSGYRKYLKESNNNTLEAIAKVFTFTAPALIITTLVLVAAFSSFIMASFVPNQNFGIFVAMVLSTALITDLTFLPALLMVVFDRSEASKLK